MSKLEHDAAVAELRQQISTLDKPWYKSSSNLLRKNNIHGLRCLDLCCGNGEFSQILREEHGMEVICADYIPFHLNKVENDGFQTITIDIDQESGQLDKLSEPYKNSFDLVVNLAAIEHVYNSDNLLRFAHTVLKPGGQLLVNTPNISFLAYRIYSLFSGNRPFGEGHHVRFWDYRFLRTNLFLNGFSVVADGREFHALPEDAMLRAFKNREKVAHFFAWFFHGCSIFSKLPFFRGLCCDELTVLSERDEVPSVGFELNQVNRFFSEQNNSAEFRAAALRFREAQTKGWLKEHLYLSKFVDDLEF